MQYYMLKSKIFRATVTEANVDYEGSITIDRDLMDAANLRVHEKVLVADLTSGVRLETYVIEGEQGSGTICMNGAAAHIVNVGDEIIIMSFVIVDEKELEKFQPTKITLDKQNRVIRKCSSDKLESIIKKN